MKRPEKRSTYRKLVAGKHRGVLSRWVTYCRKCDIPRGKCSCPRARRWHRKKNAEWGTRALGPSPKATAPLQISRDGRRGLWVQQTPGARVRGVNPKQAVNSCVVMNAEGKVIADMARVMVRGRDESVTLRRRTR